MGIVIFLSALSVAYGLHERRYLLAALGSLVLGYLMLKGQKNQFDENSAALQSRLDDAILK